MMAKRKGPKRPKTEKLLNDFDRIFMPISSTGEFANGEQFEWDATKAHLAKLELHATRLERVIDALLEKR